MKTGCVSGFGPVTGAAKAPESCGEFMLEDVVLLSEVLVSDEEEIIED